MSAMVTLVARTDPTNLELLQKSLIQTDTISPILNHVHCIFPVQLVVMHREHDGNSRREAESYVVMHKRTTTFSNSFVDE